MNVLHHLKYEDSTCVYMCERVSMNIYDTVCDINGMFCQTVKMF